MSFLHWMQTRAPRHDGGHGYPELRLRPDVTGTEDGFAKAAHVRESRRIRAEFTLLEHHLTAEARAGAPGAETFTDSVGTLRSRITLHPKAGGGPGLDLECLPFQLPLGALLPERVENLLPAGRNIGATHLSAPALGGHAGQWSIGEAVGALVSYCLEHRLPPRAVRAGEQPARLLPGPAERFARSRPRLAGPAPHRTRDQCRGALRHALNPTALPSGRAPSRPAGKRLPIPAAHALSLDGPL